MRVAAVLIAVALFSLVAVACGDSGPPTAARTVASDAPVGVSVSPSPAEFVDTWRSAEGNLLVVSVSRSGYVATLYTGGQKSLQATLRERAASLVGSGESIDRWKLSWDTDHGVLVLSDHPHGVLMFTRVSSSTASPSAQ